MKTLAFPVLSVALAFSCFGGVTDVEAEGWYNKPHVVGKGETLNLRLKPGTILGGGWHKAALAVEDGGRLVLSGDKGKLETVEVRVGKGGVFTDDLTVHNGFSNRDLDSYHVIVSGQANFPHGVDYVSSGWGRSRPRIELLAGSEVTVGGNVLDNQHARMEWHLGGGRLAVNENAVFDVAGPVFLKDTETEVFVADGKVCDMRAAAFEPGAALVKTGRGKLILPSEPPKRTVREGKVEVADAKAAKRQFKSSREPVNGVRTLWTAVANPKEPVVADLGAFACTKSEAARGICRLTLRTDGKTPAKWGVSAFSNDCYLAIGDTRHFIAKACGKDARIAADGGVAELDFAVPKTAAGKKATLHFAGLDGTSLPVEAAIQKGLAAPKFRVLYDTCNRNYRIDAAELTNLVSEITYTYPEDDAPGGWAKVTTSAPRLRRRFPENAKAPFVVRAEMKTYDYGTVRADITVTPVSGEKLFRPPAPVDEVIVGICAYDKSYDLIDDIIARDLCNLYVIYSDWGTQLTKEHFGPERSKKLDAMNMRFMTIYGGAREGLVSQLHDDWGGRYLENNVGEYCGFLYQGAGESPMPRLKTMTAARERLLERWVYDNFFLGWGRYGYHHLYSTSGSPLANYELQGGLEVICNELYALGAENLGYATAEARGAARRWKPAYWAGWNAQEWQIKGIPYAVDQKYDMLYAGYLLQYAMGTSLVVLESGAQTTQAWQYTEKDPGKTERVKQTFDDYAPRRYRDTVKKFWEFVKANPRDKGSPETRIALVLGNTDGYVGLTGPWLAMWGNHKEAVSNKLWRCGAPEQTFRALKDKFYPCGKKALAPYGNGSLAGTPFGQTDVVCVDDESRLSDVRRYRLLVYGGWNLMTPTAVRTLDKFTSGGGTVLLANPHFSTRDDREYANYAVGDMIQPKLAGVTVTGRATATGAVTVAPRAPAFVRGLLEKAPAFDKGIDLAEVRLAAGTEVVASVGGRPLLVRRKAGEGWVWYWTGWQYPGADKATNALYADLAGALAREVPQRITVESASPDDDDAVYCNFAAYGTKAYFVNLDCIAKRTVRAKFADGTTKTIEMAPCSLTTVELPKSLQRTKRK